MSSKLEQLAAQQEAQRRTRGSGDFVDPDNIRKTSTSVRDDIAPEKEAVITRARRQPSEGSGQKRKKPTIVVYASSGVATRFRNHRKKTGTTSAAVAFAAIDVYTPVDDKDYSMLKTLLEESRYLLVPLNGSRFSDDEDTTRYVGGGNAQIPFSVTTGQQQELDRIMAALKLPMSTWIAPVLNAYLPGRKDIQPKSSQ